MQAGGTDKGAFQRPLRKLDGSALAVRITHEGGAGVNSELHIAVEASHLDASDKEHIKAQVLAAIAQLPSQS
jgi:hypothetical protein